MVWLTVCAAQAQERVPSVIVVFVHGRYEDASGDDWIDDDAAYDGAVVEFKGQTPMGIHTFRGVSDGTYLRKRVRDCYWRRGKRPSLSEAVEKRVGRGAVLYARYDARDAWYYEPKAAPAVAAQTRAWLQADAGRAAAWRNVVWIAHSNGGLIVRALMSDPQYADLVARTREVITIATPHRGSEMADASMDGDRVRFIADALVAADITVGRTVRFFGPRFTIFDMAAKMLAPYLARIRADVTSQGQAEGWGRTRTATQMRAAQAEFLAQVYEHELSGRICEQLTTRFMEESQLPEAMNRLLPAAELPVPFFWIRGNLYPMDPVRLVRTAFDLGGWDEEDLIYFAISTGIISPRLEKRFPDHPEWHHSDGAVSVESAAALGLPLGGDARKASFQAHHSELLFHAPLRALVDRHLHQLMTTPPPPVPLDAP